MNDLLIESVKLGILPIIKKLIEQVLIFMLRMIVLFDGLLRMAI